MPQLAASWNRNDDRPAPAARQGSGHRDAVRRGLRSGTAPPTVVSWGQRHVFVSEERVAAYVHACHYVGAGSRRLAVSAGGGRVDPVDHHRMRGCWCLSRAQSPTCICTCLWRGTASPDGLRLSRPSRWTGRSSPRPRHCWRIQGPVGRRVLPWVLLVAGNVASLAANVAVAEPTLIGRVIAAWPLFALTASDELFTHIGFTFLATHEDAETSLVAGALPDLV
jgi:hypothetical protein